MKYFIYISLLLSVLSGNLSAQKIHLDTLINIRFEGVTLKQALNQISEQYDVRFSYSDSKVQVSDTINVNFDSIKLSAALKAILKDQNINFSIIGNQVVLSPFNINQTITIRGKVIDKSDGLPIPFANISLSGTHRGTSSNEEGEFQLALTKLPSELMISHLSHEKKLIYVYDDTERIVIDLEPAQTTLKEITVSARRNQKTNYQLIKKAYNILSKSQSDMKYGKAFYRQKSQRENKYTEIFEMFYDVKYSANGIEDWAVQEGRYAFQTNEKYDIFLYNKNFTLLSRMFPIQQPSTDSYIIPIHPRAKDYFDLDLKDVLKFDERFIAVISFAPREGISKPIAKGELYIDFDTYQVLKMKGTITNEELEIIGFTDSRSDWKNYNLDFEISFIDDESGQLLMDYVQIDHRFDYYYQEELIGNIKTSSILTFYEHYTPVANKRLGGSINFSSSDMDVIDGLGYNPTFWSQNPIVKRTPLEDELIQDFELNEAFGAVFLNNKDEVVLLPDNKNSEKARQVISRFESNQSSEVRQSLYLRLDKDNFLPDENLRFAAYVLDKTTLKPFVIGSVLELEIFDSNDQLVIKKKYDIHEGTVYGELALSELSNPGTYHLKAFTNANENQAFEKDITITYSPIQVSQTARNADVTNDISISFYPESGTLLSGINSKMIFTAFTSSEDPLQSSWNLTDGNGTVFQTIQSNDLGVGYFEFRTEKGKEYFLKSTLDGKPQVWELPQAKNTGISMTVSDDKSKSIQVKITKIPATPKVIYLVSTSGGKVFSFFEKTLHGTQTIIDLPLVHIPSGVNTLLAMDISGNILSETSFFIPPQKLHVELVSSEWKSRRNNRLQLKFRISDQNGSATNANLSAICTTNDPTNCQQCDIRNYLYFGGDPVFENVDLNIDNDSIDALINNLLILSSHKQNTAPSVKSELYTSQGNLAATKTLDDPIIAEVSISGNFSAKNKSNAIKIRKKELSRNAENPIHWIPTMEIDEYGITILDYRVNKKNEKIYVNIQGVSHEGLVGYQTFMVDPVLVKTKKRKHKTQ